MKVLNKTKWGAIALVFAMVLASGLALTGCDFGLGPNRGFDPVGTWRSFGDFGEVRTITLFAGGTGIWELRDEGETFTQNITYSVAGNYLILRFSAHIDHWGHKRPEWIFPLEILDNNRLQVYVDAFTIIFTRI